MSAVDDLLRHHGDVDAEPGLLDFAVNVRSAAPPPWLRKCLAGALDRLGHYPSAAEEDRFIELCAEWGLSTARLGTVDAGSALDVEDVARIGLDELRAAWEGTLPTLFGA